ncbi:Imm21 family immunity protein [Streptomyces griseorubiginosus]|uniref:Imm21 family immunity protein n=1 Tax=Streptomyces griseorubiginosus TaxID=67304 RepID=UPI00281624A9|nr:Imm21 family immunity protein [Streptomyces griseorubiginosus]
MRRHSYGRTSRQPAAICPSAEPSCDGLPPTPRPLKAVADAVLADRATEWEECGTWVSDGPAVLIDSAEAGTELEIEYPGDGMPDQVPVPLPVGRWRDRATHTKADEEHWVGLVQLLPTDS